MKADVVARFEGLRETMLALGDMDNAQTAQLMREAIRPALTPMNTAAKANARSVKDTGTLARSIGKKDTANRNRGTASGIVGPRRGSQYHRGGRKPTKYMHLVEFGFTARDGSRVPGKFILRNALESTRNAAQQIFRAKLSERVLAAMRRNARRRGIKV